MNYFFALELPEEAQQYIHQQVVSCWKPALKESTKWYAPDDYHVTLKFLGDIFEDRQPDLISVGNNIAAETVPFKVTLTPPGAFPEHGTKQIFWIGVRRNTGQSSLADALDRECSQLGYQREQRLYTPHITVARLGRGRGRESDGCISLVDERLFPAWQAGRFLLM